MAPPTYNVAPPLFSSLNFVKSFFFFFFFNYFILFNNLKTKKKINNLGIYIYFKFKEWKWNIFNSLKMKEKQTF